MNINFTQITLNELIFNEESNKSRKLIIPKYQRNEVWTEKSMKYLIETILLEFPFPPIVTSIKISNDDKSQNWILIDGQQRLNTIRRFFNNEYKMSWSKRSKELYENDKKIFEMISETDGKNFREFSDKFKNIMLNYEVLNLKINSINEDKSMRELFSRINVSSRTLNKQEIRKAEFYSSEMNEIYSIADEYIDSMIENKIITKSQIERAQDVEMIMICILLIEKKSLFSATSSLLDDFSKKIMDDKNSFDHKLIRKYIDSTIKFFKLIKDNGRLKGKYYFEILFYLINIKSINMENLLSFANYFENCEDESIIKNIQPIHTKNIIYKKNTVKQILDWIKCNEY